MGSMFRKTTTRPIPAGATIARQGNKPVARWKTRAARWKTAPVVTLDNGRQVIRQESSTYFVAPSPDSDWLAFSPIMHAPGNLFGSSSRAQGASADHHVSG
jgi:hypothetical protein